MFFIDILCPHYPFYRRYQGKYYHALILENHSFLPAAAGLRPNFFFKPKFIYKPCYNFINIYICN